MITLKLTEQEAIYLQDELEIEIGIIEEDLANPTPRKEFDDEMRRILEEKLPFLTSIYKQLQFLTRGLDETEE